MELTRKNKGFEWFLWLALALCMWLSSCGARKKSLQVSKTKTEEQKDLSVFNQKEEIGLVEFTKVADALIIEPDNPNEPLIVNNDTIHNAKKVTYKKVKVDSVATMEKSETTETKDKGTLKTDSTKKDLQVENEGVNVTGISWSIWGIVVLIILGVIIYFFRGIIFKKDPNLFD